MHLILFQRQCVDGTKYYEPQSVVDAPQKTPSLSSNQFFFFGNRQLGKNSVKMLLTLSITRIHADFTVSSLSVRCHNQHSVHVWYADRTPA